MSWVVKLVEVWAELKADGLADKLADKKDSQQAVASIELMVEK